MIVKPRHPRVVVQFEYQCPPPPRPTAGALSEET